MPEQLDTALYWDPSAPVPDRVNDLLNRMTLAEKVGQMLQLDARGDVEDLVCTKHAGSILHTSPAKVLQAQALVKQTRLRIPLLVGEDVIHGHSFWPGATIFPTQLGMAATWNPDLVAEAGRISAAEASATGIHWGFSPVLCIARDLRWGRVNETFGEDPFLIGELGSALVLGYQGSGPLDKKAIMATAKHFAGYSETQGGRDASEADISPRKLESWFLPPFERVAREGCASFMLGYQTMDGVPITLHEGLLTHTLRDTWGYHGVLITDWDNVGRMVWEQQIQPDYVHAAAAAINAGNDIIMVTPQFFDAAQQAVHDGLVSEDAIDQAVRRILTVKFERGMFEDPREPDATAQRRIGAASHRAVNLEIARRSLVLLRNPGNLPLPQEASTVAVLGPLADDAQFQLGDWAGSSGQVDWMPDGHPRDSITTILDGLRRLAPHNWTITHERGAEIVTLEPDPEGEFFPDGQPRPGVAAPAPVNARQLQHAVDLARAADHAIIVVGDCIHLVGEGRSTATLDLLGGQQALIDEVIATGTPTTVVLLASKPHVLPDSTRHASVIWVANPGMEGGQAIAELLLGRIEPSGRLPISFARHVGQQPTYYNQVRGQHGTRYADLTQDPAFAFGEGLAYTTFEYAHPRVDRTEYQLGDTIHATIDVTNTGHRPALETVQLYIRDLITSVSWVDKELKGYTQVHLDPGETKKVSIDIPATACSIVDPQAQRVVEPGAFQALIGHSSRDRDLHAVDFTIVSP